MHICLSIFVLQSRQHTRPDVCMLTPNLINVRIIYKQKLVHASMTHIFNVIQNGECLSEQDRRIWLGAGGEAHLSGHCRD